MKIEYRGDMVKLTSKKKLSLTVYLVLEAWTNLLCSP